GGDDPGKEQAAAVGQDGGPSSPNDAAGFGNDTDASGRRTGAASRSPLRNAAGGRNGRTDERPGGQTRPGGEPTGGGQGGPGRTKEPPNKYTPQQVCNSGPHGGGYYVQRSLAVPGGTAYLLYNSSGYNCAVMLKTRNVGTRSPASVWIQRKGGRQVTDSGSYAWYAGPVYVSAPGVCVRFGSGSTAAPYGNCG
ncbi:MAG: hypothetical protein IRY90_05760, partial [Actinomadura rubrobrunea]|nr:hypothetical protein [Actinomadura rubrobrunea]